MSFLKPFRERNPIAVGLISVAVLSVAMVFAFSINRFTFFTGRYVVGADFADAAGLTPENEVRVAGIKVGKVRSVELTGGRVRDRVRVTMDIDSDVRLGRASTAEIKLKTLLGSKFVSITPRGGAPFIEGDNVIPLDRTVIPFEIYQVQNRSVSSLGELDADALNDALRELARVTEDPEGNLGRALQGLAEATEALAQRDTQLESLLGNAALVGDVLASRSEELGRIIDSGSQILGELQRRRESLKEFVRGTDRVAGELADLISDTRGDLDPALRDLHTALEVVRANFADLEDALVVLSVGSESFGRVFTQGEWGDVFLEGVELPLPIPASGASDPTGLSAIFGVAR